MDHATERQRWDDLAAWVAKAADGGPDPDLEALVARLERAYGLPWPPGADPSGAVTARRFARVHAAALAGTRLAEPRRQPAA